MAKAKVVKNISDAAAEELSQIERLEAYVHQGYVPREEDELRLGQINQAFRIAWDCKTSKEAQTRLSIIFPDLDLKQLLDDTVTVYGNFFEVNKAVLRRIQESRYEMLYQLAVKQGKIETANIILSQIDKLYQLHKKDDSIKKRRKLPSVVRTSNPEAFYKQRKYLDEQ